MKKTLLFFVLFLSFFAISIEGIAQFSIYTNYTAGSFINPPSNGVGGNSCITFQVANTNTFPVMLNDVETYIITSNSNSTFTLWYTSSSSQMNGAPNITTANGWSQIGSTSAAIPATSNNYYTVLSNLGFIIPASTTYRFALQSSSGTTYAGTTGGLTPSSFTTNGVTLYTDQATNGGTGNIGYGGSFPTPANNPRGFAGTLYFLPALPCTGIPTPGNVIPMGPLSTCVGAATVLTDTGYTMAQNITFQWQQSTNGGTTWSSITGATSASYTATPSVNTDYRVMVTCTNSSSTVFTNSVSITVTPPGYAPIPYFQDFETWSSKCDVNDVPDTNFVNGPPSGNESWRRVDQGSSAGWTVPSGGYYIPFSVSGTKSARFHSSQATIGNTGNLDMYLDMSTVLGQKQLYFYHINTSTGPVGTDSLNIFLSTNGGASFTQIAGFDTAGGWRKRSVPLNLNPNSPQTIIRFQSMSTSSSVGGDVGIDSVYVAGPCSGTPAAGSVTGIIGSLPASLCAGNVLNLMTVGTTLAGGLNYQWQQSTSGNPGTWSPASGGQGSNTQFFTTPTLYDTVWYRAVVTCGANADTTAGVSINVASPSYATVPYDQSFESWLTQCGAYAIPDSVWASAPYTGMNSWRRNDQGLFAAWGGTNSTGVYSPTSIAGNYSARFHSTTASTLTSGNIDLLLDCSQQTGNKQVEFHYLNTNGNDSLGLSYSTDNGFTFTNLGYYTTTSVTATSPTGWTEFRVPLPSNSAQTIVRFTGYADDQNTSDIGLDSVKVVMPCNSTVSAGVINNQGSACPNAPFVLYLIGNTQAAGLTYDWQSSLDNVTWTSTGNTGFNYTVTISQATYFRVIVTCTATNAKDTTPVQLVTITPFYYCYCNSGATSLSGSDVGNVTLASMPGQVVKLNNGTANPLTNNFTAYKTYTDYRNAMPATILYQDSTYDVSITQINLGGYTNAYVSVWIDTSRDGIFDPGELVLQKATSSSSFPPQQVDSTFKIATAQDTGITGMRVVITDGTTPISSPCGIYTGGETEDYLVRIFYPPCDGPVTPGVAVASDTSACVGYTVYVTDTTYDKTRSGVLSTWQESPDSIVWANIPGSDTLDQIQYVVTAPVYLRRQFICANPVKLDTTVTNVVHVSINPPAACYCLSQAVGFSNDTSDIGAFLFKTFTNNVGGPHLKNPQAWRMRTDYTQQTPPDLWIDSTYNFSLYHIMSSNNHADAKVTIFIDFDADKQYDIPAERVFTGYTSATNFNITGNITIAPNALPDLPVGMRVILNNDIGVNGPSDSACGTYISGETEDYVVIIRSPLTSVPSTNSIGYMNIFPNPTDGRFTISYKLGKQVNETQVRVTDVTGSVVWEQVYGQKTTGTFSEQIDMEHLAKGVYFVELRADKEKMIRKIVLQ